MRIRDRFPPSKLLRGEPCCTPAPLHRGNAGLASQSPQAAAVAGDGGKGRGWTSGQMGKAQKSRGSPFPSCLPLVLAHNHMGTAPNRFPFWPGQQRSRYPANSPWHSPFLGIFQKNLGSGPTDLRVLSRLDKTGLPFLWGEEMGDAEKPGSPALTVAWEVTGPLVRF